MKIVKKIYDQLLAKEKSYGILNNYRKLMLQQRYDSLMIKLKIFCKSGPNVSGRTFTFEHQKHPLVRL